MEIDINRLIGIIGALVIIIAVYILLNTFLKKTLLKKVKSKKMKHNVIVFVSVASYLFLFISLILLVISVTGSFVSAGITAGLLTAALGWALQRPITGIAGWIMVLIAKPFQIGDRIIIGSVKGDVSNITLSHIFLSEFGGTTGGEETSGRTIIIPNAVLFEQNVVNYTSHNEYILDEVGFTITFSSDIEAAKKISIKAAEKITKEFVERVPSTPFIRSSFQQSGVDIRIKYYTIASKRQEINSDITEEIFKEINKNKDVHFAFQHTEVFINKKK